MHTFKIFFLLLSLFISLQAAPSRCDGIYFANNAPDILNTKLLPKTTEICYKQFAIMHSGLYKTPLWSAEHLQRSMLMKKAKRSDEFHADTHLSKGERAELTDYLHSGYDRGHMAPSGDFDTSSNNAECFTLANMVPQIHANNSGIWADIENATRSEAKKQGEIYVITGPLFLNKFPRYIGKKVAIPSHLFKAIYIPANKQAGVYITENNQNYSYKIISVAELEKLSKISFFPQMSPVMKGYTARLPKPKPSNHGYKRPQAYQHTDEKSSIHENDFFHKLQRKVNNFYYRE